MFKSDFPCSCGHLMLGHFVDHDDSVPRCAYHHRLLVIRHYHEF